MKSFMSFLLAICCLLTLSVNAYDYDTNLNSENNFSIDLTSYDELTCELEVNGVDIANSDEYDVYVMLHVNEGLFDSEVDLAASSIVVEDNNYDEVLAEHREKVKNYYLDTNEMVATELNLDEYNYSVSFYSPYIEIVFDDVSKYQSAESELIESINNNLDIISSASSYAFYMQENEEIQSDSNTPPNDMYSLQQAFEDIGVNNSVYTGAGVKVAIIESAVPLNTSNLKEGYYTFLGENYDMHRHPWVESSIIGGTTGIAENAYIYCMDASGKTIINACNEVIANYGVNIINLSLGVSGVGAYTEYDASIDTIIYNTGCTIVKSAGNEGAGDNPVITSPGCAMNAITVGSMKYNKELRADSSWQTSRDYLLKPDVVAPGHRLYNIGTIPDRREENGKTVWGHSGTSYAAPMVVGTVALLMEEFPLLKANPALVKSVLHLGAEMLPTQSTYFDEKVGFGLINYQNMRECLLDYNSYWLFTLPENKPAGTVASVEYNVTIPYLKQIDINVNLVVISNNTTVNSAAATPQYTDYRIEIYNDATSQCVASSTIDSSVDYLYYTNTSTTNSSFTIKIVLEENSLENGIQICAAAFAINDHTFHSYGHHFQPNNKSTHWNCCACGDKFAQAHVKAQGSVGGGNLDQYCKYCGAYLGLGPGTLDGVYTDYPHTENGSYILPNGIIVLVPEDEEAYLNGTLEFRTGEIM